MFNFIIKKFKNKPVEIEIGSLWVFVEDRDDPSPSKYRPVQVVDVKKGWVLYGRPPFKNARLPIRSFRQHYKLAEGAAPDDVPNL